MKKSFKVLLCLGASLVLATTAFAAKTELYALDGRTIFVDEDQVELYTAEGMGWYIEKPVTMYSADGRTLVVPANKVEAHKNVGWFLEKKVDSSSNIDASVPKDDKQPTTAPTNNNTNNVPSSLIAIKYTDGTIVSVPQYHVDMYKALGWTLSDATNVPESKVTMYAPDGTAKEVSVNEADSYKLLGWSTIKPESNYVTLYFHDGTTKNVPENSVEEYKAQGWYKAYDEAIYAYAAFGDGKDVLGATQLLENKQYEMAFSMVQDALDKIINTDSEYVSMLYYLRTVVTDTWREDINSPLGFINYWFTEKDGKWMVAFEYRNVSNSRIQSFRVNFDICNEDGEVIETNNLGSYYVSDLQMVPCEKKKVAWNVVKGDEAHSIKNLKVKEVVFSDGTKWNAAK